MSKLHNVRGRITYISSHAKQENLYAVYETTDRHYWTELARFNQQEFLKSGTEGKCIEARELIIALPESLRTTPCSQNSLNALAIDEPLEYARLALDGEMQAWVDAIDSLEVW